jgi:hypothetical protein
MCILCVIKHDRNEERIAQAVEMLTLETAAAVIASDKSNKVKAAYARSLRIAADLIEKSLGDSVAINEVTKARLEYVNKITPSVTRKVLRLEGEFYSKYGVVPSPEVHSAILDRVWIEQESAYEAQQSRLHSVQPESDPNWTPGPQGPDHWK